MWRIGPRRSCAGSVLAVSLSLEDEKKKICAARRRPTHTATARSETNDDPRRPAVAAARVVFCARGPRPGWSCVAVSVPLKDFGLEERSHPNHGCENVYFFFIARGTLCLSVGGPSECCHWSFCSGAPLLLFLKKKVSVFDWGKKKKSVERSMRGSREEPTGPRIDHHVQCFIYCHVPIVMLFF